MAEAAPTSPLLLASRSPQRRAILEQLGIPFEVIEPRYEEHAPEIADATEAEQMLEELSGKTHVVMSGLCLLTPGWEVVEHEGTRVTFRELNPRDLGAYLATGEWEGRAGAYAIQGRGAALVSAIEGDYLNVVGLPAALLVRLLAERFAGTYGFG